LNSQGTMSDMDRSSSDDNISVDSHDDVNESYKMDFSEDEEDLISRLYNLLGQRWALIAGRIPGRTADEIKKYCSKRYVSD